MTIDEIIENFRAELAGSQSHRTLMTYTTALNHFREFLSAEGQLPFDTSPADALTVDHALDYVKWLHDVHFVDQEVSKSTLATYLASISRFYSYLRQQHVLTLSDEEYRRMDTAFKSYRKGTVRPIPQLPSNESIDRVIAAARSMPQKSDNLRHELCRLRNIAVLETLRSTGIRVGELVALRRDDLDHQTRRARIKGTRGRERFVQFDETAWYALDAYLKARADGAGTKALYTLPVFARHDRAAGSRTLPVSTNTIRRIFYACAKHAGLDVPFTPHTLRHAFAARILESTGDLTTTQGLLGHASPTTTRIYSKVSRKKPAS